MTHIERNQASRGFSPQEYLRLHVIFLSLVSMLLGVGCATQFVTKKNVEYVTTETSTLFLFNESGRRYLLPVTGEGFFPAFRHTEYILVREPINDQTTKRILKSPSDFYFPFSRTSKSGTITIHDNLRMIDMSIKTDASSGASENSTYNEVIKIPYMTREVMELYAKANTMNNDELMFYVNSETYTSGVKNRNIILSYLVDAGRISAKYSTQIIGVYFDERNIANPPKPLNLIIIYNFNQELVDKIEKYSVIVYDYDYLK